MGNYAFDVGTRNCLQTTYVPGGVLYPVEQFPRCDLLRLDPQLGDSSRERRARTPSSSVTHETPKYYKNSDDKRSDRIGGVLCINYY